MGGADVYCAICGGPVTVPWWPDEGESEIEYTYDPAVIREDRLDLDWLKDVRVIGEDPASTGLSRIWVSGPARHDDHGYFYLEDDDPIREQLSEEDAISLRTYAYKGHHSFAVPYHQTCRDLLSKYLDLGSDGIDKDMFFQVLRQLAHTEEYAHGLKLDYGSVSENQEQYWCVNRGEEHFVHSPLDIPSLAEYLSSLPQLEPNYPMNDTPRGEYGTASDPITSLPMELRLSVLLHTDITSVMRLLQTSKALYHTKQSNSWWKRKLLTDMPWLFEFLAVEGTDKVDWARVYKDMWLGSRYQPSAHRIAGLANRRRIWEELLPQIAEPYEKLQKENEQVDLPDILQGASSTGLRRLVSPEPEVNSSSRSYFAQSIAGLRGAHIEFHVHIDQEQFIRGLLFVGGERESEQSALTQEAFDFPTSVESVQIPANDCLTGIIVTSCELPDGDEGSRKIVGLEFMLGSSTSQQIGSSDGDRRLIHVAKDHFAVGIETFSSSEGGLSRISLIQQPAYLARGIDRFSPRGSTSDQMNLEATKYLWRKQIPPLELQISEHHTGYWTYAMEKDLSPMEALVFGTTDAELADITSISINVLFGGVEVRYENRPSRSIGPRNVAMKTLTIDGQGGERLVGLNYVVTYIPMGIRVVTNWGRQLVVGQAGRRQMERVQYPPQDPETKQFACLVGMYGWWSRRSTPKSRLEAVGCLFAPELDGGLQGPREIPDLASGQGPVWEPSAPSGVRETGSILGEFCVKETLGINSRTLEVLGHCTTVSWFDCSRPLSEVRVTLCHSFKENQVPVSALTFKYADGANEVFTIGPEVYPQSRIEGQGETGDDWCWCCLSGRKAQDELSEHPHYQHCAWELGGKRLQSVRAFLSPIDEGVGSGSRLAGIQFVAEDGSESPKWSHWGFSSDEDYVIEHIAFTDEVIGLKVFMGETHRSVTYEDTIVYALQAMERLT
ncbi:unnamed protein product [Clonostachys rosea]|uniref:F-box domain-containing protein n=1 Tax=Bionectria ochroleuca TaxID=29856 RepID=A0ABY6U782_BIOOC|nr:unnamed protein product [Clonostachys rosea]